MEYKEISKIVTENVANTFVATFSNGSKKKVKMWYSARGVCIMNRKSRKWGHLLDVTDDYDKWVNLVPFAKQNVDVYKRVVKRAKKIEKMLDESGLWANIKDMLHTFLYERNEEEQKAIIDVALGYKKFDEKDAIFNNRTIFESLARDRCFKTINWFGYEKESFEKLLDERIKAKEEFRYSWHKGYDNSVELMKYKGRDFPEYYSDDMFVGYYSEEYTGCGNGYYYLLLDAKHALFCERD